MRRIRTRFVYVEDEKDEGVSTGNGELYTVSIVEDYKARSAAARNQHVRDLLIASGDFADFVLDFDTSPTAAEPVFQLNDTE